MSRWGSTLIKMKSGDAHEVVEYPDRVVAIRDGAIADGSLMRMELPSTPTGQIIYLDPREVESIAPSR